MLMVILAVQRETRRLREPLRNSFILSLKQCQVLKTPFPNPTDYQQLCNQLKTSKITTVSREADVCQRLVVQRLGYSLTTKWLKIATYIDYLAAIGQIKNLKIAQIDVSSSGSLRRQSKTQIRLAKRTLLQGHPKLDLVAYTCRLST